MLLAISMVIGIALGTFTATRFGESKLNIINTGSNKINYLLQLIDYNYVDTVDVDSLVEVALPKIISELDPHSVYIPVKDVEASNEDLKGSFSGIGISFRMEHDSVTVMSVIHGGPAEKVGLLAGDRIISANGKNLCKMQSTEVMKHLKGEKDTEVKLEVIRRKGKTPLTFTVVRGDIPVESVDASFLIDEEIGYIRIKNFGENTFAEMLATLAHLHFNGMKSLVIDLRGNRGGYMHPSIQMANEFLEKDQLIVYTEGSKVKREEYRSNGLGSFKHLPLVVLVDEMSASSSEIFAGAIQDNDRGVIVGRRSFGKGLVQEPINFTDGSGIRLTVSRFYTPSGRCIQKPYGDDYQYDIYERYAHGEMTSADSMKVDTTAVFYTVRGRRVYGGGGIIPDLFVPLDTTKATNFFINCNKKATQMRFAQSMFDKYGKTLAGIDDFDRLDRYMDEIDVAAQFLDYASRVDGLKPKEGEWEETAPYLMPQLKALVGRFSKLSDEAFYRFYVPIDDTIQAALKNPRISPLLPTLQ